MHGRISGSAHALLSCLQLSLTARAAAAAMFMCTAHDQC